MGVTRKRRTVGQPPTTISSPIRFALLQLLEGHELACDARCKPWDFGCESGSLVAAGATTNALRWLVVEKYAQCAVETTQPGDPQRKFEPVANLALTGRTCFVLTESGVALARKLRDFGSSERENYLQGRQDPCGVAARPIVLEDGRDHLPQWDAKRRELHFEGQVVKRFKVLALNQQAVLAAFQEEGWPPCIDDPLPPKGELSPKRRLHDTIRALNRKHLQKLPFLRFVGNGTGENIVWELWMPPRGRHTGTDGDDR